MLPLPPSFPVQGRALAINVSTLSMIIIHFESTLTANIHNTSRELMFRRYHC
ncbi:hypothetical protein M422DRAFT_32894 [Sphaerobolus stellatus SS14]|uniref:Uncharacterized protein n=1 Tax=Sphaerobolus stellatus (strain SS14) TaxID=990650 RepID=A0A0C9VMW4_SPHS4|nr:hypothetical protein M422DRAFT_32894 [Sphaerobolus stellatus SS14]